MRRVVVTGMGMVTPLGDGVGTTWHGLLEAKSGIRPIQSFDVTDLPTKIAGTVPLGDKANGHFNADSTCCRKTSGRSTSSSSTASPPPRRRSTMPAGPVPARKRSSAPA